MMDAVEQDDDWRELKVGWRRNCVTEVTVGPEMAKCIELMTAEGPQGLVQAASQLHHWLKSTREGGCEEVLQGVAHFARTYVEARGDKNLASDGLVLKQALDAGREVSKQLVAIISILPTSQSLLKKKLEAHLEVLTIQNDRVSKAHGELSTASAMAKWVKAW